MPPKLANLSASLVKNLKLSTIGLNRGANLLPTVTTKFSKAEFIWSILPAMVLSLSSFF